MCTGSFMFADSDGDGFITAVEFCKYQKIFGGSKDITLIDTNSNLNIDIDEWFMFTGSFISADSDNN